MTRTLSAPAFLAALVLVLGFAFPLTTFAATNGDVLINEFSSGSSSDWVELYNASTSPINLSGWKLEDLAKNSHTLSGTIAAGGFATTSFGSYLNNNGDEFFLLDANGATSSAVAYGSAATTTTDYDYAPLAAAGESAYRVADGGATWATTTSPTEGYSNIPCAAVPPGTSLAADATFAVTSDPDSGNYGNWATDTFNRHVQIWQANGGYCAKADDSGTFTTFGAPSGISPNSTAALPEVVTGTFTGSTYGTVTGGSFASTSAPANLDCAGTDSATCTAGTISYWVKHYFGNGATYNFGSGWSWTYNGGSNGTWVDAWNSITGNIVHVQPTTVYVDPTTGVDTNYGDLAHPFKTVAGAMSAVADAGTVELVATTTPYSAITITKPLTLTSADANTKAQILGTVTVAAASSTVSNLDITNPTGSDGVIVQGVSNVTVSGNAIHDIGTTLTKGSAQAIDLSTGSGVAITGDTFSHNVITNIGTTTLAYDPSVSGTSAKGIYVGDTSGTGTITNLTIQGNTISDVFASTTPWVPNMPPATGYASKYGRGGYGVLINFGGATTATITGNTIAHLSGYWAHGIGLEGNTPNTVVSNNVITSLSNNGSDSSALRLEDNAGGTSVSGSGNTLDGTALVVGAGNIMVDSSAGAASGTTYPEQLLDGAYRYDGLNAFTTIQAGVSAAGSGGTVQVAPGSYAETVTLANPVSLLGPNASINPNTGTRSSEAMLTGTIIDYAGDTSIKGFTITNPHYGGSTIEGVHLYNAGDLQSGITIENNIFSDINNSEAHGAYAVMVQGAVSDVHVSDNKIDGIASAGWAHAIEVTPTCNSTTVPQNVSVDGNVIKNVSSTAATPDAYGFSNDWCNASNVANASQTSFYGNDLSGVSVRNLDTAHTLDASKNYWGSASGPDVAQADTASVSVAPWYTSAALTTLRWKTNASGSEASTTVASSTTLTGSDNSVSVTATISSGTTVTGDAAWDGTIEAPTATTTSLTLAGYATPSVTSAITVGSSKYDLVFSQPVKLVFAGQAGKRVGFYNAAGTFSEITEVCDGADMPTVHGNALATTSPGESCKHDAANGTDLNVWTTHFSTFATYSATLAAPVLMPGTETFFGSVDVTMDNSASGATIRYTTNTVDPTCSSGSGYANGQVLTFTQSTTLKAIRCDSSGNSSAVTTESYGIAAGGSAGGVSGSSSSAATPTTAASPSSAGTPATAATPPESGSAHGEVLGASVYNFAHNLGYGATGADVVALQKVLIAEGFDIPWITKDHVAYGFFGPQTKAAVTALQKAHGIATTGFLGTLTRAVLNAGVIATTPEHGTNLSASQAQAIVALLQSFGADASVIANVKADLGV